MAQNRRIDVLEKFVQNVGRIVSYLCGLLILAIVGQVIARYIFGRGFVVLEELEWHLYAIGFLIGLSYCAVTDTNVRMDLFYRDFSKRKKAWMEMVSVLVLLMPFVIIMFVHGISFVEHSWALSERSEAPLGLPSRWAIKAVIPIALFLLFLAGLARFLRALKVILLKEDSHGGV